MAPLGMTITNCSVTGSSANSKKKEIEMRNYIPKTQTIDPERGNCLLLYTDKVRPLTRLPDNEFLVTMRALCRWFIGKISFDEALLEISDKCKNGLLCDLVESIMSAQQRHVQKYIANCEKRKRRSERNAPCIGVMPPETRGESSRPISPHLAPTRPEAPRGDSSRDEANNYN